MSWSFEDRAFMVRLPSGDKIDIFALLNTWYKADVSQILLRSVRVISTERHVSNLRHKLSMYDAQLMFVSGKDVVYRTWLAALPVKIHVGDTVSSVDVTVNGDAFAASLLLEGTLNIRLCNGDGVEMHLVNMPAGYELYMLGSFRAKEKG